MRPTFATLGRALGIAALLLAVSAPALAQRTVTLRMNSATIPDTLAAGEAAGIDVRGCLDGCADNISTLPDGNSIAWDDRTTLVPAHQGGDFWDVSFEIPDATALNFKFYSHQYETATGSGWEDGGDHRIEAGTGDVMLDLHYFEKVAGDQDYDWRPFAAEGDSVAVWLRVYMNTVNASEKGYDASDAGLSVGARGNFGSLGAEDAEGPVVDWGEGGDADEGVMLSRESGDATRSGYHLFSGVVKYPASAVGETANYKFYFFDSDNTGDGGYENGDNRTFTVPEAGADTTIHWVYYSNSPPLEGTLVTSQITFSVDVAPLTSIGLFTTGEDNVQVRGGFNGWDCPAENQDDCGLLQEPFSSTFSREFPLRSLPGTQQEYKYYLDFQPPFEDGSGNTLDIGWEEPLDYGGGNRPFEFAGTETQAVPLEFFNGIRQGNVIDEGTSVAVRFTVDMNAAVNFTVDPFDPASDSVSVQFEDNVWLLTQGYEPGSTDLISISNGNAIAGFKLEDPDGDLVYEGTLIVDGPTYNGIGYRYFYSSAARSGPIAEGAGGFSEGRRRYRYITPAPGRPSSAGDTFDFALDTFKSSSEATPWEINPTSNFTPEDFTNAIAPGTADDGGGTANADGPGRDGALALGALFPNPTSGLARVRLDMPVGEAVAVAVFDVTGRQVATVFEGPMSGARTFDVDTRGWAAGVYVVRAQAASGVATRMLTVVR